MGDPRWALGAVAAAVTFAASYALQRLASGPSSLDPAVIALVHVPFYWRCGLATFQGLVVGALVAGVASATAAERLLDRAPLWMVPLVGFAALTVVLVP